MKKILKLSKEEEELLKKKSYGLFNHSAVQVCTWNKKALTGKGVCYKEKFYGVNCHKCLQFTPISMWCQQNCTFCWRPMEYMKFSEINKDNVNKPKEIVENLTLERKKLLSGFKGNSSVNIEKWKDALIPDHYAISLSGEPTLYPYLNELVQYLKTIQKARTIFVVSNGQETEYFKNLINDTDSQPTQLYISIDAPNKELFNKINRSTFTDGWERLLKTLKYFSQIECRRVFRLTQIKGLNDIDKLLDEYNSIFELGKPDIIEVKAYMHIGLSRKRHTKEQMPFFEDIQFFVKKILETNPNYEIAGEMKESRIIILRRKNSKYKTNIFES